MKFTLATLLAGTLASLWLYRVGRGHGYEARRQEDLGKLADRLWAAGYEGHHEEGS